MHNLLGGKMRIIMPVNDDNITSGVCVSFGRAPYFMVWDTQENKATFVENPGANSSGGAGVKAAQCVVDQKVDSLIVPRIGKNASDVTDVAAIKLFQSVSDDIMENITLAIEGKLIVLTNIHPGFHNHGEH